MDRAADQIGNDDWGEEGFTEPAGLLIESCLSTGYLSVPGAAVLRSVVLRHLRNRLYLRAYMYERPHAVACHVNLPVVITGLPRTGTSLLHNLLAQDPRYRFLALWQALHPVPPRAAGPDRAELVARAETWLERFYAMTPDMRSIHPLTAEGPEECDALLQNAFVGQHLDDMFDAEEYSSRLYATDLHREYAYYALQLRILSEGADEERRWLLKSPLHVSQLDALREALPGVRILHCHRDPAQAVPSFASLILAVRRPNSDPVSLTRIGHQALWRSAVSAERAVSARGRGDPSAFFDVPFRALVRDPIGTVGRIYGWLEEPLDPAVESAMRSWLAENPRDRHGSHEYDARAFGLDPDRVRGEFDGYLDRFGSCCSATTVT
jgi:hypothetical protein